jgi:MFS family permease
MAEAVRTWPHRLLARPWLAAFVPVNAATAGFGVALPLLILIDLHGGWADVALAAGLYNAAVILSSVVWGVVSDRYKSRRVLLLLNFTAFAFLFAALAFAPSIPFLLVLYVGVGLVAPAGSSAANLLILERFDEAERPTAYASFQEMSILGSIGGLLVGYFWLIAGEPLPPLLWVLAALSAASVLGVAVSVRDPVRTLSPRNVAMHPESLASRLRHLPIGRGMIPFFPVPPQLSREGFRRFRTWARGELRHELPLIFAASFLFNLGSNLFNISYTPYLYSVGLAASSIFLVNFANNMAQGLSYPLSGSLTARTGPDRLVVRSSYLRALGYLAVAGFTLVPLAAGAAYGANLAAYAILGAAIAFYSTASSLILFRTLRGRDAGSILGLNSALGGVAAVAGAALSGILSVGGSYRLTFLVSAGTLLASLPLWTAAHLAYQRRRGAPDVAELSAPPAAATGPAKTE